MAKFFDTLLPEHTVFIARQKVFFVATQAPGGRINLSPKGLDSLRVLDDHTVAYLDLTGSGAETAAHLRVDPRLTLMLCGFGVGCCLPPSTPTARYRNTRGVKRIEVQHISTSPKFRPSICLSHTR